MDLLKSAKSAATSAAKDAAAGAAKTAMATGMSAKNAMECRLKSGVHDFAGDSDVVGYLGGVNVEWDWNAEPKAKFGHRMKELHFNMPMGRCLHNSGSYGVTPTCVLKARHEWEMKCQENTVLFRFITCPIRLPHVVSRLAYRVGADPNNLALMTNANQATSTVFKSISWSQGDKILLFSCDYHATHLAVEWLEKHRGVEAVVVDMPLPCTAAEGTGRSPHREEPPAPQNPLGSGFIYGSHPMTMRNGGLSSPLKLTPVKLSLHCRLSRIMTILAFQL